MIRVELYEMARRLAGTDVVEVEASTLGEALRAVAERHPALAGTVIVGDRPAPTWRANVDGREFVDDPDTPIDEGQAILLLSAMAGG